MGGEMVLVPTISPPPCFSKPERVKGFHDRNGASMSSRLTYANGAAVLTDWVLECGQNAPEGVGAEDAAVDFIAAWLCNGNSMQELVNRYGLNWGVLAAWIRKDDKRNARYQQAMLDRSAFRKEKLLDGWWTTAVQVPEDVVTHGDVHKARESLAKAEGLFSDAARVVVDNNITIVHESV